MKKIVITGSEGLIGKELCKSLKKEYKVICLDITLGHDLTNPNFVEKFFMNNKNLYGLIILHAYNPKPLINSKKIEPIDYSLNDLKDYFNTNVISAFDVCRNFIKNNKSGRIINVSSLYGEVAPKHHIYQKNFTKHIGYGLSKSSIIMLTKYLATYYSDYNINTVVLGGVFQKGLDKNFVIKYNENTPKKRMMKIKETISCFKFLLDPSSTYVTGTEIKVDGGWTAW